MDDYELCTFNNVTRFSALFHVFVAFLSREKVIRILISDRNHNSVVTAAQRHQNIPDHCWCANAANDHVCLPSGERL